MKEGFDRTDTPVLGDFFKIKRGLATGNNSYFILSAEEIEQRELPMEVFRQLCYPDPGPPTEVELQEGCRHPLLRPNVGDCEYL